MVCVGINLAFLSLQQNISFESTEKTMTKNWPEKDINIIRE